MEAVREGGGVVGVMTSQDRRALLERPDIAQAADSYVGDRRFFEDVFAWASLAMDTKGVLARKHKEFSQRVVPAIEAAGITGETATALANWKHWDERVRGVIREWFRIADDDLYEYYISICITQANMNDILRSGMDTREMTPEDKAKTVKLHKDALMDLHDVIKKKREVVTELFGDTDAAKAIRRSGPMAISPEGFAQ